MLLSSLEDSIPPKRLSTLVAQYGRELGINAAPQPIDRNCGVSSTVQLGSQRRTPVGISNILQQQTKILFERGISFNVLVCGTVGVGKTTVVNSLFGLNGSQSRSRPGSQGNSNRHADVVITKQLHEIRYETKTRLKLGVIEVGSFGTKINNYFSWNPILNYIDWNLQQYWKQNSQPYRTVTKTPDNRVHLCLYVLEPVTPTELKPLDLVAMKELGDKIPLIPVINKTDIYTSSVCLHMSSDIGQLLAQNDIRCYHDPIIHGRQENAIVPLRELLIDQGAMIPLIDLVDTQPPVVDDTEGGRLEWSSEYLARQLQLRRKYNKLIELQDCKFNEWINTLYLKQRQSNKMVEQMYLRVTKLQEQCRQLEQTGNGHCSAKVHASMEAKSNSSKTLFEQP
ncbi:septin SPR3 KNAG_0D04110 [Huiozyma naganishii CBS 8797]|uniref:Septin-type G domain-containing protein n=1 Tax=Huiozyma naganishii (strain ATCC MYA-139 / BCRC 22969 / CBS 8797 / KCTC 17520 / NBRC 10181 / NCYC 3082 / Yp74L-3) TaxID=1071383 RepID=J7RYD1_HUIN7|nr:hypothetical protein KNAG_0D04110 [Kazachstania naganishii CBS 8797]CCK70157.1 hypothetical protein KNAG_0D04110 [Kazachstania naganishii CBS 8797]